MASLVAPAPVGSYLEGFLGGQMQGAQLQRLQEASLLNQMRLKAVQDQMAQQQAVRSIVPQILGAQPQQVEISPAVPGTPPQYQGTDYDAFAQGTPGRPAVTEPMMTLPGIAQQIGTPALGTALAHPQGRAALQAVGAMTHEEAERRRRRSKAILDFKSMLDGSREAYEGGRVEEGLTKEIAAYRALAEAADNPAQLLDKANDLSKSYFAMRGKQEQAALAGTDMQRIGKALAAYHAKPDFETYAGLQQAMLSAESEFGQRKAHELLLNIAQGKANEVKFMPFQQVEARVAQIVDQQVAAGGKPDRVSAIRQAMQELPQASAQIVGAMFSQGKPPDDYAQAMFGSVPMKNVYDEATANARARGLVAGSPEYAAFISQEVTRLEKERQAGRGEQARETNLVTLQNSLIRDKQITMGELRRAREQRDTEAEAQYTSDLEEIQAKLKGIQTELERRGVAPVPIREDKPLPFAKNAPAALETKDPPKYEARAREEVMRLIRAGHSKESAITEMRRRGWSVK